MISRIYLAINDFSRNEWISDSWLHYYVIKFETLKEYFDMLFEISFSVVISCQTEKKCSFRLDEENDLL